MLAGQRGAADPFAASLAARHRALLPVAGMPMLLRVIRTLRETGAVGRIALSIDEPAALDEVPELRNLIAKGEIDVHRSLDSPSRSVSAVLADCAADEPLLVTTADHPLLTPEMVAHFAAAAGHSDADLLVGVVAASLLRRSYPETTRTYVRLRGEAYSGANLFCFRTERARRAARFWLRVERQRKSPWRMVRAFGPRLLLRFALRRLDLDAALEAASQRIGAVIRAVSLPFPEAAIDVDRPADLELAERILAARAGTAPRT